MEAARAFFHLTRGLRRFYARPITRPIAEATVRESVERRAETFLGFVREAVFGCEMSPYRWLFGRSGIEFGDLAALVERDGLEGALERVLEAGVYLTLDEFKGRRPLRRGRDEFPAPAAVVDNPLTPGHLETATGGSSGPRRRLVVDLELIHYDACCNRVFLETAGLLQAPFALWRPVPPGSAGVKRALAASLLRQPLRHWFTPHRYHPLLPDSRSWVVTTTALVASRVVGSPIPMPEFVPLHQAERVARWVHETTSRGETAHLDAGVSSATLVVRAARDAGLELRGAFIRTGSEPLTPGRAALLKEAGARVACHYSIAETGPLALGCCHSEADDEAHLMAGKIAVVMRRGVPGIRAPGDVSPLFLTSLLPVVPKVLINVESGDTAVMRERVCDCRFSALGLTTRLQSIRSYEKLTAGGMHFLGSALLCLIEQVLPQRFGGAPTDYQFVEYDDGGISRVGLRVHPGLGALDEGRLRETIYAALERGSAADRMMVGQWRQGGVLEIHRVPPAGSPAAKILPLCSIGRSGSWQRLQFGADG